jgi:carbamoyltransferase
MRSKLKRTVMWTLGIHAGKHNSSLCLLENNEIRLFVEEERLSRIKYDSEPIKCMSEVSKFTTNIDNLIVTHCNNLNYITHLLKKNKVNVQTSAVVRNDIHHLSHAASAFYGSGFDEAVCVVFDGRGSELQVSNGLFAAETLSIYKASYPATFTPLFKRLTFDPSRFENFTDATVNYECEVVLTPHADIGAMYQAVANLQGFNNLDCGKTMGLAAYGNPNPKIPPLTVGETEESNLNVFTKDNKINTRLYPELQTDIRNSIQADLASAVQKATQHKALNYIKKAIAESNCKNVVISGGYALNIVSNKYYKDQLPEIKLFVDPLSSDGGLSFGSSKLLYHSSTQDTTKYQHQTLYLGPPRNIEKVQKVNVTAEQVAKLLTKGKTIAIYQGRSEAGARALGNRSIVFNPTLKNGKELINKIKNREWFRPFAGTVLQEHSLEWFDLDFNPFMTLNAQCKKPSDLAAIVHEDGTCRVQTLSRCQNKNFYNLIHAFYELTGVPVLGNTSLNVNGEPIVETLEEAYTALRCTDLDYLYLPETADLISPQDLE